MGVLSFVAQLKDGEPQAFSNPYDAMAALIGTEGEADVYVDTGDEREGLLHRDADGVWSEVRLKAVTP
jgi:hypothetical protein